MLKSWFFVINLYYKLRFYILKNVLIPITKSLIKQSRLVNYSLDKGDELAKLQSVSSGVFGETVQSISFLQSYTNSENRLSHSFRFHVCSKFFALSPVQFKILEKKFRILLPKSTSVEVR